LPPSREARSWSSERAGEPSRRSPWAGEATLTPLILVRIQVPQPYNLVILPYFISFRLRRISSTCPPVTHFTFRATHAALSRSTALGILALANSSAICRTWPQAGMHGTCGIAGELARECRKERFMTDSLHNKLDRETITKAYARWAPVYDLVFGAVFERGRSGAR